MSCMQKFLYFNYKVTRILGTAWGKSTILILNLVFYLVFISSIAFPKICIFCGDIRKHSLWENRAISGPLLLLVMDFKDSFLMPIHSWAYLAGAGADLWVASASGFYFCLKNN